MMGLLDAIIRRFPPKVPVVILTESGKEYQFFVNEPTWAQSTEAAVREVVERYRAGGGHLELRHPEGGKIVGLNIGSVASRFFGEAVYLSEGMLAHRAERYLEGIAGPETPPLAPTNQATLGRPTLEDLERAPRVAEPGYGTPARLEP